MDFARALLPSSYKLVYIGLYSPLPSGYVKISIENNYDIYIVDLPIQNGDYLWLC